MIFPDDEVYVTPIPPPDCEGGFADIECDSHASVQVHVDLTEVGTLMFLGAYCEPCAAEVRRRLTGDPK